MWLSLSRVCWPVEWWAGSILLCTRHSTLSTPVSNSIFLLFNPFRIGIGWSGPFSRQHNQQGSFPVDAIRWRIPSDWGQVKFQFLPVLFPAHDKDLVVVIELTDRAWMIGRPVFFWGFVMGRDWRIGRKRQEEGGGHELEGPKDGQIGTHWSVAFLYSIGCPDEASHFRYPWSTHDADFSVEPYRFHPIKIHPSIHPHGFSLSPPTPLHIRHGLLATQSLNLAGQTKWRRRKSLGHSSV